MVTMNQGLAAGGLATAFVAGKALKGGAGAAPFIAAYVPSGIGSRVKVAVRQGLDAAAQGRGSPLMPYATIDAAVAAIGKPTTLAQYEGGHTLDLEYAEYDVSKVVLPMGRWQINLLGGAKLVGQLRMEVDSALAFGSVQVPSITIKNQEGFSGRLPVTTTFKQSSVGTIALVQNPLTVATPVLAANVSLEGVQVTTITASATMAGPIGIQMWKCSVSDPINIPGALVESWDTNWLNTIVVAQIDNVGGSLNNNITVTQVSSFKSSNFSVATHVFTGNAAAQLTVDGNSNYRFKIAPWTIVGTTKLVISDNVP